MSAAARHDKMTSVNTSLSGEKQYHLAAGKTESKPM